MKFIHYEYLFSSAFIELSVKTTFLNFIISKLLKLFTSVTFTFGIFLTDFSILSLEFLSRIINELVISNFLIIECISLVFLISLLKSLNTSKFLFLFFSVINEATLNFFSLLFNFLFL